MARIYFVQYTGVAGMHDVNDWAIPSTRVADAVKIRPISLGTFYRFGCDPWEEGAKSLAELCESRGWRLRDLLNELASLPLPARSSRWEELPVHFLIDYLTSEHRQFLDSDLPAFRSLLETPLQQASGGQLFSLLLGVFLRFSEAFRDQIRLEEERIFPAILMNEYALRYGGESYATYSCADRCMISRDLFGHVSDVLLCLDEWLDASRETEGLRNHPKAAELADQIMQRLEGKIRSHGELERDRLIPIAFQMESELSVPAF